MGTCTSSTKNVDIEIPSICSWKCGDFTESCKTNCNNENKALSQEQFIAAIEGVLNDKIINLENRLLNTLMMFLKNRTFSIHSDPVSEHLSDHTLVNLRELDNIIGPMFHISQAPNSPVIEPQQTEISPSKLDITSTLPEPPKLVRQTGYNESPFMISRRLTAIPENREIDYTEHKPVIISNVTV